MGTVYRHPKSKYYWIAWKDANGVRQQESSKKTNKGEAQDILTLREGAVLRGEPITRKTGKRTLGEALKSRVDDMRANGRKSPEDAQRRIDLHLLPHFGKERRLTSIGTTEIRAYIAHRLDENAKPATVNRELATLKRAFRLAAQAGDIVTVPYVPMLAEHNVRKGFFERSAFESVRAKLPDCLRPLVTFMYWTGWRSAEVKTLEARQVDKRAGVVRLEPGTTKSGEGRQFYFGAIPELRRLLVGQLKAIETLKTQGIITSFVFHRPDGKPIKSLRKAWKTATAEYPEKRPHDFRRTAVRNLERAGVPRSVAMAMVGHKTESIYRRYAIVDEVMMRDGAAQLNAFATAKPKEKPTGRVKRFQPRDSRGHRFTRRAS